MRVVVRGPVAPSDEEFGAHVAEAMAMASAVRAVLVVYSPSSRISAQQRAQLIRTGLFDVPHAVLADGVVAKAELEAMGGLGGPLRTFAKHEFDAACEFLAIPPPQRPALRLEIALLASQLGAGEARDDGSPGARAE